MSLSKTWYSSGNLALADTSTASRAAFSALWALGAMLTGNQSGTNGPEGARPSSVYWTLVGSSNSSTAGMDSTDRLHFAGSFTAGDWVRAAAASPHTWFVLQSPSGLLDGPWYLCVDYIGPTNDQNCSVIISNNAFSGGSTSARPTATQESVATSFQFISTTAGAGKTYLTTDANGGFRFLISRNGTGYFSTVFAVEPTVEYHSTDPARTFMWAYFLDSGTGAPADNSSAGFFRGRGTDGTALTATNVSWLAFIHRFSGQSLAGAATTTNSLDSTIDVYPAVYICDNTTSHKGGRGRLPDCWWVGAQVAVGSTVPASGSPERMVYGTMMGPGSVAPSL
jgi:hypothetical protein